jgi:6-phosphogluconolactonase (cycloisomerase 2 family)
LGFSTVDSDSAGSVNLTPDGRLLFVVNAGDNTISSFRVTESGLKPADRIASGGILPVSLTSSGDLLYVLNELSGSIYGLRFSNSGELTPIVNSLQALSTVGPSGLAAQIGFAPGGNVLVVIHRALGVIDMFRLRARRLTGTCAAAYRQRAATIRVRLRRLAPGGDQRGLCRDATQHSRPLAADGVGLVL